MSTALLAGAMGACAAVSGLSAYTSSDCPGGCDASVDGSPSADGGADGTTDTGGNDSIGNTEAGDAGATGDGGCGSGLVACDGGCVDVTSVSNCGSCGNVCGGSTPACAPVNGVYSCVATCPPSTPTDCSGTCVDTTSNANDCSACSNACSTSVANAAPACVTSACTFRCNNGYVPCSGACVNEQTDNNNCGGCGSTHTCTAGQTCTSGVCADAGAGCDIACPTSTATTASCPAGGCNTANAACPAAGQGCFCSKDSHCKSGKCVKTTGQNDLSCGTNCTGAGAADGFGCQLVANGIPSSCRLGFGYTPSNFTATAYTPPAGATTNCSATYSSTMHTFTVGACTGTAPTIQSGVVQAGGPNVDILVFSSLAIASGSTLTLTGSSPVILAVYGDATLAGNIIADGAPGGVATGPNPAPSGPGGNSNCGTSVGGTGPSSHNTGGGGGGATGGGGKGGNDTGSNTGGAGGASRANPSIVPLYGGCPGGAGGDYGAQAGKSPTYPGGGGGAVQISVAGTLSVTGTISAQGGSGASGTFTVGNNHYAGGAGGGSGGAVLLEGNSVSAALSTTVVSGGPGGASGVTPNINPGGLAGTSGTPNGGDGTPAPGGNPINSGGGGGGGGYGYLKVHSGLTASAYSCATALSPAPVCNPAHTACLCVADSDCSSGKCLNVNSQCTGACTGSGVADSVGCESLTSAATAWSCSIGNCDDVASPTGTCSAAGVACWCTSDAQCSGGKCVTWAGCAAGACTGSGGPSGFHCFP